LVGELRVDEGHGAVAAGRHYLPVDDLDIVDAVGVGLEDAVDLERAAVEEEELAVAVADDELLLEGAEGGQVGAFERLAALKLEVS
jgi:hypothetical protein